MLKTEYVGKIKTEENLDKMKNDGEIIDEE